MGERIRSSRWGKALGDIFQIRAVGDKEGCLDSHRSRYLTKKTRIISDERVNQLEKKDL